jgi:hypothetical protein
MSIHAPSEVEATLQRLSQHRGVRGVMILSNDTGRVLQHTGAMLETPASPAEEDTASESVRRSGSENQEDEKDAAGPANGHNVPLVNATVRKYADAVRRIVAATKDAVEGLDEKVGMFPCNSRCAMLMRPSRMLCGSCACGLDATK